MYLPVLFQNVFQVLSIVCDYYVGAETTECEAAITHISQSYSCSNAISFGAMWANIEIQNAKDMRSLLANGKMATIFWKQLED